MKKILVLVLALALLLSTTAFAAVELEMNYWMSEQEDGILAAVDAFNASQDEIHVNASAVPWGQYWDKLTVGLPAGSAPDVFSINALNVIDYARNGYLLDITDLFESGALSVDNYPPHTVATHTVDGVLWGVPKDYDNVEVYYLKSAFDAAGLEYPTNDWTWDEFLEIAAQLTDADNNYYGVALSATGQALVYDYIYGGGGQLFAEDGTCVVNSEENIATLKALYKAYEMGVTPSVEDLVETDADTRFQSGMCAMVFSGSWNMAAYAEAWGDDLGVVALPVLGEHSTISHSLSWCGAASTQHPDEVKTFLTYLGGEEASVLMSSVVIPAYGNTADLWAEAYADNGADVFTMAVSEGWAHPLPAATRNAAEVFNTFDNFCAEVMSTGEVESNLAKLQDDINALIAE